MPIWKWPAASSGCRARKRSSSAIPFSNCPMRTAVYARSRLATSSSGLQLQVRIPGCQSIVQRAQARGGQRQEFLNVGALRRQFRRLRQQWRRGLPLLQLVMRPRQAEEHFDILRLLRPAALQDLARALVVPRRCRHRAQIEQHVEIRRRHRQHAREQYFRQRETPVFASASPSEKLMRRVAFGRARELARPVRRLRALSPERYSASRRTSATCGASSCAAGSAAGSATPRRPACACTRLPRQLQLALAFAGSSAITLRNVSRAAAPRPWPADDCRSCPGYPRCAAPRPPRALERRSLRELILVVQRHRQQAQRRRVVGCAATCGRSFCTAAANRRATGPPAPRGIPPRRRARRREAHHSTASSRADWARRWKRMANVDSIRIPSVRGSRAIL